MEPLASGAEALALIPQRPPFVLVDTLIDSDGGTFGSAYTVPADHVLVENGALLEGGLMENVAQTAALGMGYTAKQAGGQPPLGFIGAISKVRIIGQALVGDRLETKVIVRHEFMSARVLEATVSCKGNDVAHMELKVFIMDPATMAANG